LTDRARGALAACGRAAGHALCERSREGHVPTGFVAPAWVPWAGFVSCAALVILDMVLMV